MNKVLIIIVAIIATSAGAVGFHLLTKKPLPEHALYYKQSRALTNFQLVDQAGNPFTNQKLRGKWSFVFFGYTSCPDVCPTTLQNLSFIYEQLQEIDENSQVLLVSVDPQRDSQSKLAQYIAYFNEDFLALRAEHDKLYPFARSLGLMYAISDTNNSESYQVDHSASLALINPDAKIAAIFKAEQALGEVPSIDSDKLLADYQKIVALY